MKIWKCAHHDLELGRKTYVMGIVNATPDSFSGDGELGEAAFNRALQLIEDGADILDIGGESTRPGALPVSLDEELSRVLPLIEKLASCTRIPISIDSTKNVVARRAVEVGASIINDVSGATFDEKMLEVVAQTNAGIILMHLRGTPQKMKASENFGEENDVIAEILTFWRARLGAARQSGIADERIAFDAGFGFGKSLEENLEILRRGCELSDFGFPTLSGTSRKSTLGKILGDAPADERIFGTAAATAIAIANGADIIRVHDVKEMAQVARVCDAICR
ncbi:Dihydropteroate synthase [Abditibacterium utsteinense]|uniref:Dihydropteroate synthase n=1 Tax=Abditibacterium utsteinense TaxID=1960156 RepID=A0A2S8SXH4_9BACT|nr:dihydropteroate synthase [Abditibacterium utsteinense]PQV65503.1 Dihydropteroate synthase [Abditibacterium utsteinense]